MRPPGVPFGISIAFAAVTAVATGVAASAQQQPQQQQKQPEQPEQKPQAATKPKPVLADTWTEERSRALFRACDADGDDRLDLFETADALDLLADATDLASFRRLDRDRDGFVGHAEFDGHFRTVVQRGDALRVRPVRPVDPEPAPANEAAATPLRHLLQLHDKDRSGDLDFAEIDALVLRLSLPKEWPALLKGTDRDGNGRVVETELQPLLDELLGATAPPAAKKPPVTLPEAWRPVDTDRDGKVSEVELAAALAKVDPSLARWSKQLLGTADKDGDGVLTPAELPPAPPSAAELQATLRKE